MVVKLRYDNEYQTIELDDAAAETMWVSLSLEGEGLSEERLQEAVDETFNKPEYNNWHTFWRHVDQTPKCKRLDGKRGYIGPTADDPDVDVMECLRPYMEKHEGMEKEEICKWIRETLHDKPEWAEACIAVWINGMTIREYAKSIDANENNITQKLTRAKQRLIPLYAD